MQPSSISLLHNQRIMSSNVLVSHTPGAISLRYAYFLLLNVFRTASSLSFEKCLRQKSICPLIIYIRGSSVISWGFRSRYLKCSFHFWRLYSWLTACSFALKVVFLFLTGFFPSLYSILIEINCLQHIVWFYSWTLTNTNTTFLHILVSSF